MIVFKHIDPTRFSASGCIIDWGQVAATRDAADPVKLQTELSRLGITRRMTHLRWTLNPGGHPAGPMGMPTVPFQVMRRRAILSSVGVPGLDLTVAALEPGVQAVSWDGSLMARVWVRSLTLTVPLKVYGISGTPQASSVTTMGTLEPGEELMLNGPGLIGLLVESGPALDLKIRGIRAQTYANEFLDEDQSEYVGLPVDPKDWTGQVAKMAGEQGFAGHSIDPRLAAADRLRRGAMIWGWDRFLEGEIPAPPWVPPDTVALLADLGHDLLPLLKTAFGHHSTTHAAQTASVTLPPPANAQGKPIPNAQSSDATLSPFAMLLSAIGTDPYLSMALGFGTAFTTVDTFVLPKPDEPPPPKVPKLTGGAPSGPTGAQPDFPPFPDDPTYAGPYDYLIVAEYHDQKTSQEVAFDSYAALVMDPQPAVFSAGPAHLAAVNAGFNRPATVDGPWSATARIAWDRLPRNAMFRPASFAAARRVLPSAAVLALMETRPSGGLAPISANGYGDSVAGTPAADQVTVVDRELVIPPPASKIAARYYVAQQDLFGRWSHWIRTTLDVAQPPADKVRIHSATLTPAVPTLPTDPAAARPTKCSASLTVEFSWDWTARPPAQIRFLGRLYPAARHGDGPTDTSRPGGFGRSIGGADGPIDLYFTGDTAAVKASPNGQPQAGTVVDYLSPDGSSTVAAGPAQGSSRRYRVRVEGFIADFAGSPHVGVALWAAGLERVDPNRFGKFGDTPYLITSSNPIPPAVKLDKVDLASLPDAAGQCHARISWSVPAGANATGYFLYTASESAIRDQRGKGVAAADETLAERKAFLLGLFAADPSRREFTRISATPIAAAYNFADVVLPRGSSDIHVYVAVATNGGNIESAWPTSPDQFAMVAAPRIAVPAAPTLEVAAGGGPQAAVAIAARRGAHIQRFDLHRVRVPDAARELDTMGPPAATITDTTAGWVASRAADTSEFPFRVRGQDAPGGSWRKVYYRAVAWADDDLSRGIYGSRSPASPAVSIVVPPLGPPDLSAVTVQAGTSNADIALQWTSSAPVPPTPLGAHRISVSATPAPGAATAAIIALTAELQTLPTATPTPGQSGVFRMSTASPTTTASTTTYGAVIRRSTINQGVTVVLRMTDPLGRSAERVVAVPAGPDPDVSNVQLTQVAGVGTVLRWTTQAPTGVVGGGRYRVRVTATPPVTGPKPRPFVAELALADVPTEGPLGKNDQFVVQATAGKPLAMRAVCTVAVATFVIRIIAPDGRFAEVTRKVS